MVGRVAVTGASGFIGRYVLRELLDRGLTITATTRDRAHLADFANRLEVVELDLAHHSDVTLDRFGNPDVLLHLAWNGLPNYRSLHHYETELPRQYAFLKQLIVDGLNSLVITGTCFEYGLQSGPLAQTAPIQPETPYGFAKAALHQELRFLQEEIDFSLIWARLFYIYGDGQHSHSLFSQLKSAVERGDLVFSMSGGEQLRDYLPVEEVARQLVGLAMTRSNQTVNICSGSPTSVRTLVERWLRENKWEITLNLGDYPYADYESMAFWGINIE